MFERSQPRCLPPQRNDIAFFTHCKFVLALCASLLLAGCDDAPEREAAKESPPLVEAATVVQKDVPVSREWVGTLDGMVNAEINAQVTGYLVQRHYQEGERVKKGQVLYQIDPRPFQAALDQARANLARQEAVLQTARLDLNRIQRLLPEKAVSVRDRDNAVGREAAAEAEVLAARAAVATARLDLEFTKIISPIDGIAGISAAQLGDLVGPAGANATLTTVSQVDPIRAYLSLSEQEYLSFGRKNPDGSGPNGSVPLELILADGSTYPHKGRVYFADRQVDVKTGTIKVAALFPNPGNFLRPGQFARIRAITDIKRGALLVPQRSVSELQGTYLVAVLTPNNTVDIRKVRPAERIGSLWLIDQGLKPGEAVIIEGLQKVKPGATVTTKPYVAETSPTLDGKE